MVTWNPFTPNYFNNPYHHLSECRRFNPVQKGVHGEWMLFRHNDVKQMLKADGFSVSNLSNYFASKEKIILGNSGACPFLAKGTKKWLMYLNGDDHEQAHSFTDALLRQINFDDLITQAIEETLSEFGEKDEFDLADLASRLPYFVSAKMMGFDDTPGYDKLRHFSHQLAISQDLYLSKQQYFKINEEFDWFYSFLKRVLKGEVKIGSNSIVYKAEDINNRDKYFDTPDDQISLFCVLFMASFETTKDTLGTILYLLLNNADLLSSIREYSDIETNILVEELLRLAAPLQYTVRVNNEPVNISGIEFIPGTKFYLSLASANRDAAVFDKADQLVADRKYNPHLSFGGGAHSCIGARIARQEIRTWLKPLASFLMNYEIPNGLLPQWQKTIFMRGLRTLPIKRKK
jgi:cytochrome P450